MKYMIAIKPYLIKREANSLDQMYGVLFTRLCTVFGGAALAYQLLFASLV